MFISYNNTLNEYFPYSKLIFNNRINKINQIIIDNN